jgi:hypothetical protein
MSFCRNTSQQMNLLDPINNLTDRERKILKNTWAEEFSNKIFPLINESRFSVLYSENHASRPNNPVNVNIGLLMLKEIFDQSDEDAIHSLLFDFRYQYALHTTSYEEQPISKNSLSNFRTAVYRYNEEHDVDIIQEEIEEHAKEFSKLLKIEGRTVRMDSLMISSSCKKLTRLEIIYSCVSRLIEEIGKVDGAELPERFKLYLEEGHRNDTIYRSKDKDLDTKLTTLTVDAIELYYLCQWSPAANTEEFNILSRMLGEQTKHVEGKVELKPSKEISPDSIQNPTDPDATYRRKGTKDHTGYVANVAENFNDKDRIITHYDLQQNTYSDQAFSEDIINKMGQQDKTTKILVDGAYYSEVLSRKAEVNNIELIPTNLVGRSASAEKSGYEKFKIDEITHTVKSCPMDHAPSDSKYKREVYRSHFPLELCDTCPHRPNCPVTRQKKQYLLEVSETRLHSAVLKAKMGTSEYQKIASKRAGIEGIPSTLRRKYDVDYLPVRGKVRSKVWLGFKIGAINCKRYIKSRIETTKEALSLALFNNLLEVFCFQSSAATIFAE